MNLIFKILFVTGLIWSVIFISQSAFAGVYSDDLTKCIVSSTTTEDRVQFVKWMYSAISKHPAVKSLSSISEEQIADSLKGVADLMMKLLTESCQETAVKAFEYEGPKAIEASFNVLGQIAGQEIFSNPDVAATISNFEKYLDSEKLESALKKK